MPLNPLAGKPAPRESLIDIPKLVSSYYTLSPQAPVAFGTSGHRGTSLGGSFNENHIAAVSQAICEYRRANHINGPLFLGIDTHALSEPASRTALEVLIANDTEVVIHQGDEYTPTPVISFLILENNKNKHKPLADGIVITPSHNPPEDGGFKYNPPHGGPADIEVTEWIQERANKFIQDGLSAVKRISYSSARKAGTTHEQDFITPYVSALSRVVDMEVIRDRNIKIGIDPMGGSSIHFWAPIAERYGLNIEIVNDAIDPAFGFMTLDSDGKIRMDCSSPYAMAGMISMADRFDIAWGNDPDGDRHGIVCPDGLMNPNHYLAVAIWYLIQNRPDWDEKLLIGKTLVSSSMIDKVVKGLGRSLYEVPVGFKWFVQGLLEGRLAFGGEESAGASFLRMDGTAWSTDKDGLILSLLAAEILARTEKTPSEIYRDILIPQYGQPYYQRSDGPITEKQKSALKALTPDSIKTDKLAGVVIKDILVKAPGNDASIGGVKVVLENGSWFAVRPSGTEPKMKVYIESFQGEELWHRIKDEGIGLIFG